MRCGRQVGDVLILERGQRESRDLELARRDLEPCPELLRAHVDVRIACERADHAVAQRQGRGPLVVMKHCAKSRRSADRRAAEHLGAVVHQVRAVDRNS